MRITILILTALFCSPLCIHAQENLDIYLEAGKDDASKLTESYLAPIMKGFGYGLNNGWYNTAKAHKSLGFDLTISAHAVFAPKSSQYFSFNDEDYSNIKLANGESNQLPTAFGPSAEGPRLEILDENGEPTGTSFNAVEGLGIKEEIGHNIVPVPMVQLGIGIVKNTDIKIRLIPAIDIGDGKVSLWGIGLMHDVKQWIPGINHLPFDLSALVGYTKMTTSYDLQGLSNTGDGNQELLLNAGALSVQGIISKKMSVLTLYGGVGYNKTTSSIAVNGVFELEDNRILEDPINLKFGESSLRATAGFQLKLAILTLHADYTINKYPILSAGLGFSVR